MPATFDPVTRYVIISGRVQGVWFRESMRMEADRLGVTGWVRNRRDGCVEAMVQGPGTAVEAIIAWCREGPGEAVVTGVEVRPAEGTFGRFEKLPTA